jgi:hypothetical protein
MDRTNVSDKGYSFNGQDFTYQNKVNSQGQNYQVALPSTISASSLATPTASIPVTQPQYNTATQQAQASQAGAYVGGASQTAEQQLAQSVEAEKARLASQNSDYSNLLTQAGGKGTDLATQYNQQDATGNSVNSLAGKLRSLNAQSQALGIDTLAKQQAEINKATGQNITQSAVTRNTADATRENLINQASIAMQSAIVNADYQTAKSYADQMVEAKYDQLKADTAAKLFNIENIKESLTSAEKKVAEATTARLKKEQAEIDKKEANDKQVNSLIIDASPVAPPDVLARAKAIQAKGGSATEVAMALGQYGGDYYKTALLKQQIETEKAQQANYRSQITERDNKVAPTIITGKDGVVATLPKASQDRYYKMQGDFDQATKTYRGAIDAAGSVKALSKDATAQDQTAIIFQYMKTLDPNSTVREGEFALVAATAGLNDRAVNAIKRLDKGQRLNEAQIKDIVGATDKLAENAKANLSATSKEYDRRATIQGLPKGLFLDTSTQEQTPTTNPNDTPEAKAMKAKLEAANPALKKKPFEGTSIIKNITGTAIDFDVPLPTTKN